MNINYQKPLTIKEYTRRFKFPEEKPNENGTDNIKMNTIISNILKKKNIRGNISIDLSLNKTIENTIHNDEKRKKILKIFKKKNKETAKPFSSIMTPKDKESESPSFFHRNNKPNNLKDSYYDYYLDNKKDGLQTAINHRRHVKKYKAITPLEKSYKKKNKDEKSQKNIYEALYRNKDRPNILHTDYINKSQIYEKRNVAHYSPEKKLKLKTINNQKDLDDSKVITTKNKNGKKKINFITTKKPKPHVKIVLNNDNTRKKNIDTLNNLNSLNSSTIFNKNKFENLKKNNVDLFTIFNIISNNNIPTVEQQQELNKMFKDLISEKKVDIFLKNQNKPAKVIKEKEKRNSAKDTHTGYVLLKKKVGKIEKEIKIDSNNFENIKLILLNILSEFTSQQYDIITKNDLSQLKSEINKNKNIINELNKIKNEKAIILNELNELKIENTKNINAINELKIENTKYINAINELNTEKMNIKSDLDNAINGNAEKDQKIKEKEEIIQKKEEENLEERNKFAKLQNEYNTIQSEYNNMKENNYLLEKENERIMGEIGKLKEEIQNYKNIEEEKAKKKKEMRNSEIKPKKNKEEIKIWNNRLKNNLNLEKDNSSIRRSCLTYTNKMGKLLKNNDKRGSVEKKNIIIRKTLTQKKKPMQNINKINIKKLVIPEEKKIKEDSEDKEELDSIYSIKSESDDNNDNKKNIDNNNNKDILIKKEEKEKEEQKLNENKKEENEKKIETPIINININNNINSNINNNKNEKDLNDVKDFTSNTPTAKRYPKMSVVEPSVEKQQKMSKALNRFRKKMSQVPNVSFMNNNSQKANSCIKKSEKIADIAKMLEKQIGFGKKEENNNIKTVNEEISNNRENIIEIIKRKPASKRKKKPSVIFRFKEGSQGD